MMEIYTRDGKVRASVMVDASATIKRKLMEDDTMSCTMRSPRHIDVNRGDYIVVDGERFTFHELPKETKNSNQEYSYECELHTDSRTMKETLFLFLDKDVANRIYQSTSEFDLTATVSEFAGLLCDNLNRNDKHKEWSFKVSTKVDATTMRDISVNGNNCKEILKKICDEFELEYSVQGKEITIATKVERKTAIEFSYPHNLIAPFEVEKGKNDKACTRLYVFGGDRNIPKGYNDDKTSRLIMPNGRQYIDNGSDTVMEATKTWDDIYPRRNSSIQRVAVNNGGFFLVTDNTIDFNLTEHLTEKTAKIAFTDGLLVGYEFEIASYNAGTKTIEIKQQMDNNVSIPNEFMRPRPGDKYVLLDITLPDTYVKNAEKELEEKAMEYFKDECSDEISTSVKPSQIWLKQNGITLNVGDIVHISDESMGIDQDIRINAVTSYPFNNRNQEIELANYSNKSRMERLESRMTSSEDSARNGIRNNENMAVDTSLARDLANQRARWATMED